MSTRAWWHQVPRPVFSFNTSGDGDSIASLIGPFPRLTTFPVKKFLLLSDVLVSRRCTEGGRGACVGSGCLSPQGKGAHPSCSHCSLTHWGAARAEMANSCVRDCRTLPQDSAGESGHVAVMSTFILYIFFNFLRQPSGELHYVCECCPSVSLPQPQQVSLTIWQMRCWGREGFCVRVFAGPLGDTHHVANTAMKALVHRG